MPHEKRAPLAYFDYSVIRTLKDERIGHRQPMSAVVDDWSDASSQASSKPASSQTSSYAGSDPLIPLHQVHQPDAPCLQVLHDHVPPVDVPSWRERVQEEKQSVTPALPPSQRQHPRRSAPACHEADPRHVSAPPMLIRQPEKRRCFVSALVIFAAGLIAAIWPLSSPVLHDNTYAHNVLPLRDFITETLRRSKTSYSTLQIAMYYLILLKDELPRCDLTQEQSSVPGDRRAMQCGRRMFLSALMLASKFLQDRNYSTRAWGKITGLPTSEINTNEVKFLEAVDWKLHVSKERFERWSHIVIALSAPPKPGTCLVPQPNLVETLGWATVLGRLRPDCQDDFTHLGNGPALLHDIHSTSDHYGLLTPPSSPPDSTDGEADDPAQKPEFRDMLSDAEGASGSGIPQPAPPHAPHQRRLPTPRGTPGLTRCPPSRAERPSPRCQESASAMSMLKVWARPANPTLCPPPQRPRQPSGQSMRPLPSRRCSISSSGFDLSSPESLRSEAEECHSRSRSSSISSVASSVLLPLADTVAAGAMPESPWPVSRKGDCSSSLRQDACSAADALLRFRMPTTDLIGQEKAGVDYPDFTKPGPVIRPNKTNPGVKEHSTSLINSEELEDKTSDLVSIAGEPVQTLVRRELLASQGVVNSTVVHDVHMIDDAAAAARQCKRSRSTRDRSSAVDLACILVKDQRDENGAQSMDLRAGPEKGVSVKRIRTGCRTRRCDLLS